MGLAGCANLNDTQQRALTGGAIGAAGGAVIGASLQVAQRLERLSVARLALQAASSFLNWGMTRLGW